MQDLTRRSFLKGLIALSVAVAVPKELAKVAEFVYSDTQSIKKSPAYILIDGEIVPFYNLSMSYPQAFHSHVYTSGKFWVFPSITSKPDLPTIELTYDDRFNEYFRKLQDFNFEIVYRDIPYPIRGKGQACFVNIHSMMRGERAFNTFEFVAELEQYS